VDSNWNLFLDTNARGVPKLRNTDVGGNDIGSDTGDIFACLHNCQNMANCQGFTRSSSALDSDVTETCLYKSAGIGASSASPNWNLFLNLSPSATNYAKLVGKDIQYNDIVGGSGDISSCQQICKELPNCKGFTRNSLALDTDNTAFCQFKSAGLDASSVNPDLNFFLQQ
jgi:hypothetical protein